MSDKGKIIAGLVIFLVLATYPIWYHGIAGGSYSRPELDPPAGALLFSAQLSAVQGRAATDLDWNRLQGEFRKNRISLSGKARLDKGAEDGVWRITDGESRYLILKNEATVKVYTGCVEERDFMTRNHMNILKDWREVVVRDAEKSRVVINGEYYDRSLTKCCMKCHTSREKFCADCHEYANVFALRSLQLSRTTQQAQRGVRCWNCHVEPKGD